MAADLITRTTSGRPSSNAPYSKGRICQAQRNCEGQSLSVYNPGPDCNACDPLPVDPEDTEGLIELIGSMPDPRHRRRAFEVLAEMAGEEEA